MVEPNSSIRYRDIDDFLQKHTIIKPKAGQPSNTKLITNTRIGDKDSNIYGGSYHIPDDEYDLFLSLYYRDIIVKNKKEYLTEKQLEGGGVILVDVDLRHDYEIDERQYTKDHIEDLIDIYLETFKTIYQFDENSRFYIFVFEKPTVNRLDDKKITKDGIHMMICLKADHITQRILRDKIMSKVAEAWSDLPVTNSWSDVFDSGISAGHTNWQLFGSRKPNHVSYKLKYIYDISYDVSDGEFMRPEIPLQDFDISKNISILSVRYKKHLSPFMKNSFVTEYEEYKRVNRIGNVSVTTSSGTSINTSSSVMIDLLMNDSTALSKIRSQEELDLTLNNWLDNIKQSEHELKDMYDFVMILPVQYYGEQSYDKWIRVGWALKNISNKLLIVWLKFSSQSSRFQISQIPELCEQWRKFDSRSKEGLTKRSIMYWARNDAREAYESVRKNTLDYYIEQTIDTLNPLSKNDDKSGCGDYDLANVLYQIFKYDFVCVSVKANIWYQYKNNRWKEIDSGTTLRRAISEQLRDEYNKKSIEIMFGTTNDSASAEQLNMIDQDDSAEKNPRLSRAKRIMSIVQRLSRTTDKKNIMTEAKELFFDPDFLSKLDMNPYLLCFNNGVFDFKEKRFRNGRPEDYISMCTNIDYVQLDPFTHQPIMDEINDFMNKLFPESPLCNYMWDHLASTLLGTTANQTFNMYVGIGRNGKSVLVQLMTEILGEYKGDVPLSMVTADRVKIGGVAPEIVQLKGKRYAVMQEPKKGDKMNEGIMKQLTGKDPITGRALYVPEPVTYTPQFKLVVTCNNLLEVNSMDHGTWRRIRAVPFKSLFTENPVQGDTMKPYQFMIDPFIDEKFKSWKEVFMSMLIKRVCETNGIVNDCDIVTERSDQYRNEQDSISSFVRDMIVKEIGGQIKKMELNHTFKLWFAEHVGGGKQPSIKDLHEYMDTHFGKPISNVWKNVKIFIDRTESNESGPEDDDIHHINDEEYG
uniref:SF3 helicase domain-containing protein n=1 Tax=viral metagenome TaxID=1070528 RepID=A0A6C0D202_9ZZZZ